MREEAVVALLLLLTMVVVLVVLVGKVARRPSAPVVYLPYIHIGLAGYINVRITKKATRKVAVAFTVKKLISIIFALEARLVGRSPRRNWARKAFAQVAVQTVTS